MMKCIVIDDDLLSRMLIEKYILKVDFLNLVHSFSDPVSALSFLSSNNVDLIFLDIEMPEMNGINFIKTIQQKMPQIVLTTSHKAFALEAFEYNVTDYLIKPLEFSRFFKAITRAKDIVDKQVVHNVNDTVFVKKGLSMVKVKKSDIVWVEALGDYLTLYTEKEKIIIHSTMSAMLSKLPPKDYMRVHRSFIVRIDKIDSIEDDTISFNEKLIPIGKTYRDEVYKRLRMI